MQKVTDNVYVESEISVCNTSVVVTKEGVVVIDTPMVPANAKKVAVVPGSAFGECGGVCTLLLRYLASGY